MTSTNYPGIVSIPLIIKEPFQREGQTSDRTWRPLTFFRPFSKSLEPEVLLGRWMVSQLWALSPPAGENDLLRQGQRFTFDAGLPDRDEFLQRQLDLFGSQGWAELFATGPYRSLVGKKLEDLPIRRARPTDPSVELEGRNFFENVDLSSRFLLCLVRGRIQPPAETRSPFPWPSPSRASSGRPPGRVLQLKAIAYSLLWLTLLHFGTAKTGSRYSSSREVRTQPVLRYPRQPYSPTALHTTDQGEEFLALRGELSVPVRQGVIQAGLWEERRRPPSATMWAVGSLTSSKISRLLGGRTGGMGR